MAYPEQESGIKIAILRISRVMSSVPGIALPHMADLVSQTRTLHAAYSGLVHPILEPH